MPDTPPRGLLIKLLASGVCHSDQPLLDVENRPKFNEKYILGHEGCGEIIRIGSRVKDVRFKVGDRIALLAVPGCGLDNCSECSRDLPQLCADGVHHGIGQDGFYAQYVAVDIRAAILLPSGIPSGVVAVATDAVTTAYHGITRRAEEDWVSNALQIVRVIGARVIVSDLRQEKLDSALEIGVPATDIVPVGKSVQDFIEGSGLQGNIDTVLEFVGEHQTFQDALQIVRPGGKILCIGTLDRINELGRKMGIRKRLSIIFTYGGQYQDIVEVLDLIAKKIILPQVEMGRLQDFPEVLRDLRAGKIKDRVALVFDTEA
ncbi:hypothetical protein N7478_012035 [Penicillium angulare]|uniref:uncharacterized protein n=1 Tax=Penicillium angulare TaxID=116970 RepID=UPI002540A9B7|nr:uncharacterized protein N7478_012035 [Penicillium angulare]KAJ5261440.1 hypothetical protein N7478_012035 [Penicillium angulare]